MKRLSLPLMSSVPLATAALLMGCLADSAWAQNSSKGTVSTQGIVTDWSSHHVIFSDPGTQADAMMKGRRAQWERIVNDPRYRMQQLRLGRPMAGQTATATVGLPRASQVAPANSNAGGQAANPERKRSRGNPSKVDWFEQLAPPTSTGGVGEFASPAKYSFTNPSTLNPITDCRDFVVFPVGNISGSGQQASLIGVDNIYGICGAHTVRFAYNFPNGGEVDNSPVLSLDGKHVAFVESVVSGQPKPGTGTFHVLTLDTAGAPNNGSDYTSPVLPGLPNNAVDTPFLLHGSGVTSGIYVDYSSDTAYVTDDGGFVHQYTTVFGGTPNENTTSPWPINLSASSGGVEADGLSAPVFDGQSQHLFFVGITTGTVYCYTAAGAACGTLIIGGTSGQIHTFVPPIVDGTTGSVFVYGNSPSTVSPNLLIQASTTDLSPISQVTAGSLGSLSGNLARGAFDNAYFTSPANGHLYVGGGDVTTTGLLALRQIGFHGSGVMNTTADGSSFPLQTGVAAGAGIAVTARTTTSDTSGNNCPITGLDTSTGSPDLILVSIGATNANGFTTPPATGTLSGATVTQLFSNTAGNAEVAVWSITGFTPNPSTSFTINTNGASGWVCGAAAFSGVASVGTIATATGTSTTPSVTVTNPGPGGVVFDTLSTGGNAATGATPGGAQVVQWGPTTAGGNRLGAASLSPPTGTMSWTLTASNLWYLVAVPLNPTSGPLQASFTSLLDVFNTSDSTERLFLGVQNSGFNSTTPSCGNTTCVASFVIPTGGTFPAGPSATQTYTGVTQFMSDIIIDNVSAASSGGSNIYYGVNNQGIQVSQSALQ